MICSYSLFGFSCSENKFVHAREVVELAPAYLRGVLRPLGLGIESFFRGQLSFKFWTEN